MVVEPHRNILPADVVIWLRRNPQFKQPNIAGNRESKNRGFGKRVERFLTVVFKRVNARIDPLGGRHHIPGHQAGSAFGCTALLCKPILDFTSVRSMINKQTGDVAGRAP